MADTYYTDTDGLMTIDKDPSDVLDYPVDWTAWLATISDTITGTPVWTVGTGLTKDSQANTTTTATAVISGGTAGQKYPVANKITTVGGRTVERTFWIKVLNR